MRLTRTSKGVPCLISDLDNELRDLVPGLGPWLGCHLSGSGMSVLLTLLPLVCPENLHYHVPGVSEAGLQIHREVLCGLGALGLHVPLRHSELGGFVPQGEKGPCLSGAPI